MSISRNDVAWPGLSCSHRFKRRQAAQGVRPPIAQVVAGMLLSLATLTSFQARATTIVYKNFNDLVKEAEGIVAGRVVNIESQSSPAHEIYTFVTLDQLTVLGGSYHGQSLTLRFKGGQVGNSISQIVGSPEFKLNEQVVLFIEGNGKFMVPVVGWTQGVFRVAEDPATGRQVIEDHEGNRVVGIQAGALVKDLHVQPAAHIVGQQNGIVSTASENKGDGGAADNNSQAVYSAAGQASAAAGPTMTSEAFLSTIRKSAAAKTFQGELKSINAGDFSLSSDSHADGSIGAAPASGVPPSQSPATPQRKPVPQNQNER